MRHHPGRFHPREVHAFAEGRQLREAAEARRRHREAHRAELRAELRAGARGSATGILFLLLAIPATVVMIVSVVVASVLSWILDAEGLLLLGGLGALPLLTLVAVHARVRRRRALRRGGAAGTTPLPRRPAAAPRPDLVWGRARNRFHALRAEYAAFECDPMEVLRLPALADVSVGSTERFVDAFAEAQALETDLYPPAEHGAAFVTAVDRAERSWRAAREAAERIRLSGLSPAERATVERVIKLLTTARDSDNDPERLAAYARARSELAKLDAAGVIHLPRTAAAALDESARGQLPA